MLGDLNLRARVQDTTAEWRLINVDLLLSSSAPDLERLRQILKKCWHDVEARLAEKLTRVQTVTNARREQITKFRRIARPLLGDCKTRVVLGDLHDSKASAEQAYTLHTRTIFDQAGSMAIARRRRELCICDFKDCVELIAGIKLEASEVAALEQNGRPCESPACLDWLQTILEDDSMIDTFAEMHPSAEGRFTCWEQYRARRYMMQPTILVHRHLLSFTCKS